MAEIKKISVGGVTYDLKDEKARTIAENPMLPVTGILDAQGGTDVTSKATSHRGIFYAGNGVFKAKSISNDTDFHSTWDVYDYNNVHYPASDVYASRGGAFSNALYLMEGSLYRIQSGAMVQVVQGSAGEGGELGEDVSIVKSGTSYAFGNGAVVGQNAQLNGTIATGANVGEGAKVGKSTFIGEAAVINGGVKIGTKAEGHGGVYINSDKELSTVKEGDTFIGKNVTIEDNATISVEMQTDFDDKPTDEQGNYLLGNNTIIGWDSSLGDHVGIKNDGESFIFHDTYQTTNERDVYIGGNTEIEPFVKVGLESNIGRNVAIGEQVEIGKQVYIEEGFSVDEGAITTTGGILNLTGKGLQSTIGGSVSIGEGVAIGEGVSLPNAFKIEPYDNTGVGTLTLGSQPITLISKQGTYGVNSRIQINDSDLDLGYSIKIGSDVVIPQYFNATDDSISIGHPASGRQCKINLGTGAIKLGTGALRSGDVTIGGNTIVHIGGDYGPVIIGGNDGPVEIGTAVKIGTGVNIGAGFLGGKPVAIFTDQKNTLTFGTRILKVQDPASKGYSLEIEDAGFVKITDTNNSKYVRIPLNNQTIGAVSDEIISV